VDGDLHLPEHTAGLVIFAHGSGSSRFSRRNRAVAKVLEHAGFGTLPLDLLTRDEEAEVERTAEHRFNIPLLGERVVERRRLGRIANRLQPLPIAFFGASTGAAALIAAEARPRVTRAVISRVVVRISEGCATARSGTDAADRCGEDTPVIAMNRDPMRRMRARVEFEIVPRATHLFEEPGALEQVARLAADECRIHLEGTKGESPTRGDPMAQEVMPTA
jgi:putative phosphoribosyl transferase